MASQFFKVLLRRNYVNLLPFRNVTQSIRRLKCPLNQEQCLKSSFSGVLSTLRDYNYRRSTGSDEGQWTNFPPIFAVFGVTVNATKDEQESGDEDSRCFEVSQETTPPENRFNVRRSNGRFTKTKKDLADLQCKKLKEGYKTWTAKRKLLFENSTDENEPPSKCTTRAAEVQYVYIALFCPTRVHRVHKFYSLRKPCDKPLNRQSH